MAYMNDSRHGESHLGKQHRRESDDARPRSARAYTAYGLLLGLLILVVSTAHLASHTYVSGQDPALYMMLARDFLRADTWAEGLLSAFRVAPVYPLLLAGVMKLFGQAGVFWVNPAILVLLFLCLGGVGHAISRDRLGLFITAMLGVWLMMFGWAHTSLYLLYPFRESLSFLSIALGWWAWFQAGEWAGNRRRLWLVVSGGAFVLAGATREPAVLALIGAAAARVPGCNGWRNRLLDGAALLAPLLAAIAVLAALYGMIGIVASRQFHDWQAAMDTIAGVPHWKLQTSRSIQWLLTILDWWSMALILGGTLSLGIRRRWSVLILFALPAVSTFVFYAAYEAHPRYALACVLYLVPLAGEGARAGLRCCAPITRRWPRIARQGAFLLMLAGGTVLLVSQGHALTPWGTRVTRQDVRHLEREIDAFSTERDYFTTELPCRHLGEALLLHLDRGMMNVRHMDEWADGSGLFYLEPLNRECFTPGNYLPHLGVVVGRYLRHRYDVTPLEGTDGRPLELALGDGRYAVHEVRPWSETRTAHDISPPSGEEFVVWLDFRDADPGTRREVVIRYEDGTPLDGWVVEDARNLQAFVSRVPEDEPSLRVSIEGDTPGPREMLYGVVPVAQPARFSTTANRHLSIDQWFAEPFTILGDWSSYAVMTHSGGQIRLPPVHGAFVRLNLAIGMEPPRQDNTPYEISYALGARTLTNWTVRVDQPVLWTGVLLDAYKEDRVLDMTIRPPCPYGGVFKINQVLFVIETGEREDVE